MRGKIEVTKTNFPCTASVSFMENLLLPKSQSLIRDKMAAFFSLGNETDFDMRSQLKPMYHWVDCRGWSFLRLQGTPKVAVNNMKSASVHD